MPQPRPSDSPFLSPSRPSASNPPYWPNYQSNNLGTQSAPPDPQPSTNNAETDAENGNSKMTVHESIASADIQNPSDALEFLANVADRAEGRMLPPIRSTMYSQSPQGQASTVSGPTSTPGSSRQLSDGSVINFAPLQRSQVNLGIIHELLAR